MRNNKNLNVETNKNLNVETNKDLNVESGKNLNAGSNKNLNVESNRNLGAGSNLYVETNNSLNVETNNNLNVESNANLNVESNKSLIVEIPYLRKNGNVEKEQKAPLSKIIATHCVNLCGNVNYNKYGVKSGNPFRPVSEIFCDNFIVYVYASKNHIKNGKYRHAGTANREISSILLENLTDLVVVKLNVWVWEKKNTQKTHIRI